MDEIKVATVSLCSGSDKGKNIDKAISSIKSAKSLGAQWVLLPEIFAYHGAYKDIHKNGEPKDGDLIRRLGQLAKELQIVIFAGTFGEQIEDQDDSVKLNVKGETKVYNSMYVFDATGDIIAKYRKTHLFNLMGPDGKPLYCESDGFVPGSDIVTVEVNGWNVGLAICYDLRFTEFFTQLSKKAPLDVIALPAAFTEGTGKDHWEVLLRARAIEQQCYVYASNQCGEHRPGIKSYGHSMVIDPWGHKTADTGDGEGIALAVIKKSRISEVRAKLPALSNKRADLY